MKKYFLTGLVILLPLAITLAIVIFLINFLTQPFVGAVSATLAKLNIINKGFLFLTPEQLIVYGSKFIILILLFLFTVFLGILARWFILNALIRFSDRILHRIPIVKTVYKTTQDIINTLFVSDNKSFQQVVMAPFPRKEVFVLGLVVRNAPQVCSAAVGDDLISVLIPTTPNPTTGFLTMYKKSELIFVDIKPEDAIKYIVSCGVILPPSPTNDYPPVVP